MKFFSNNPFIKILGFWFLGILLAKYCQLLLIPFVAWVLVGVFWYGRLFRKKRYPFDLISSTLLATTLLLASALNYQIRHPRITATSQNEICFLATLLEKPIEKANSFQTQLRINKAEADSLNNQVIICWIQKSDQVSKFATGDNLFCQGRIRRITNQGNPFEFDYQNYLAQQGIYYSCYLRVDKIWPSGKSNFNLRIAAEKFREKLLNQLHSKLKNEESFQVISALSLGYRKELSPETRSAFTQTGAMHVLAVSGLHVGLIFLFLLHIFSPLKRSKKGKWVRFSLILLLLWSYALITGLSPSVQRATMMFTFLLLAESLNRNNSIYNSIAASAFTLLFINPDILFAVGFQLSYAAVLSIVYFYPLLDKILPSKNPWLKKPWQLLCVSLAAQIGTFPLTIYYFNQFPVYFWLSNFVVIPAAFLLLAGTFIFFITTPVPVIQEFFASALDNINSLVLLLLKYISHLPGAVITNISITTSQLAALFATIISIILFIRLKRAAFLRYSLFSVIVFQLLALNEKRHLFNQHRIITYKNPALAYHFVDGRENYILTLDTSKLVPNTYSRVLIKLQLNPPQILSINAYLKLHSKRILIGNDICQFGTSTYLLPGPKGQRKNLQPILNADSLIGLNNSNKTYSDIFLPH